MKINRKVFGTVTFCVSIVAIGLWAYWGIIETFHEGWYSTSLMDNVLNMLGQYLSPMMLLTLLTIVSIYYPKPGALIFFILGVVIAIMIHNLMLLIPFLLLAIFFWLSEFKRKKLYTITVITVPLLIILLLGTGPLIRVSKRYDDGNYKIRKVVGNEVELIWAPEGPGFPDKGTSWHEAKRVCSLLSEDGQVLMDTPQNYWRLAKADEVVRSMSYQNKNCSGILDTVTFTASYKMTPDKESPLWKVHSKVIYWWTATEIDSAHAYMIAYDGELWSRQKKYSADYLGFRAVKVK